MPNYAARRPGTRCRACRNGRHRADPYPGDLGLGEKQLRPTFSDLATTMACWPVVLRSDALRTCVNRDRTWRGKTFTAAAIRRYQRCALSDSVALLAEGRVLVVFPEGYPNIDAHTTRRKRGRRSFFRLRPVLQPSRLPPRNV